jgi:hypothetical protein
MKMPDENWRPKLSEVTDVIAESHLEYRTLDGTKGRFLVKVGRPCPHDDDYYCPLEVEGLFHGVKPIFGMGPVDSLMNAMELVRRYFAHMNGLSTEPLPKFE